MKKNFNLIEGTKGELLAINYLKKIKYNIIETNYKNKLGEIDIIAKINNTIVFVEVKERETSLFGRPCEAVDYVKQNKIRNVATLYLIKNKLMDSLVRFDVIEVIDNKINHIINAF